MRKADFDIFGFNHDAYIAAPVLMYDLQALFQRDVRPPIFAVLRFSRGNANGATIIR